MNACTHRLSREAYYATIPVLLLSAERDIIDLNIAASVLLGAALHDWRGKPMKALLELEQSARLGEATWGGRIDGGCNGGEIAAVFGKIATTRYGTVRCWCAAVPGAPPDGCGMTYIVPTDMETSTYWTDILAALDHAITWEAYARSYDRILPRLSFYQEAVSRHVTALLKPNIASVLDIGAGTGNVSLRLAQKGVQVSALDISRAMLEQLLAKRGDVPVALVEASAESIDQFADGVFDGVTILLALFDMSHPKQALTEAIRVLRCGGLLVITEPRETFHMQVLLGAGERELRALPEWPELSDDWQAVTSVNRKINPERRVALRAESILGLLRQERFLDLQFIDSHMGTCATVIGTKPVA